MLTTVAPNGALHSRPMGTQPIGQEGDLWFLTWDDSLKTNEIARNHRVNVAYTDTGKQTYISVTGKAEMSYDRAKILELWTPITNAWFPNGPSDPNIALLRVKIEEINYWQGPGKVVTLFTLAASALTGEAAQLGEHGRINPPNR